MIDRVYWSRKFGMRRERPRRLASAKGAVALTKRRKFVLVAVLLCLYLYFVQSLPVERRYSVIALLAVVSAVLSGWSLIKDIRQSLWAVILTLPTFFPVSVALFYFLLPQLGWTRVVVIGLFGISMYALLLTANILNVASIRTIQLLRAARTVGFLLSVITSALFFQVIFTLKLEGILIALLVALVSFPIFLQGLWTYSLSPRLERAEWMTSAVLTLIVVEVAAVLSFWLIEAPFASIMLAMVVYVLLGLFQHRLEQRLFSRTVAEYLSFALIVVVVITASVVYRWMM